MKNLSIKVFLCCFLLCCNSYVKADFSKGEERSSFTKWLDKKHDKFSNYLDLKAQSLDDLFDKENSKLNHYTSPATLTMRVIMDSTWNKYDGFIVKPKLRAKIKLYKMKKQFVNLVIGDDSEQEELGNKKNDGIKDKDERKRETDRDNRKNNASISLQWYRIQSENFKYSLDLGIRRINDPFLRARANYLYKINDNQNLQFSTLLRYGVKTKFYNLNAIRYENNFSEKRKFTNLTELSYSNKHKEEEKKWENSTYLTDYFSNNKNFSYGISIFGDVKNKKPKLNGYGPFISYNQPIYREWINLHFGIDYFNDKKLDRKHYPSLNLKLEAVF